MKKFLFLTTAAFAIAAMTGTADAAKKKHRPRVVVVPHAQYYPGYHPVWRRPYYGQAWGPAWQRPSWGSAWGYGPYGNDFSGRRDPSTWEGPLNPWDRARRDDALLSIR